MSFFKKLFDSIISASSPTFSFKDNALTFKVSSDNFYKYELLDYDLKTRHDPYVLEAYTLKTKDVFLEYIKIDDDSSWNGSAINFYETFLKNELRISSLEKIEDFEIENYVFRVYKINNNFILFFIYIYEINKDIFILDVDSKLYRDLLLKIKKDYKFSYNDNNEKAEINFDISLVKRNSLENFFSYEKE